MSDPHVLVVDDDRRLRELLQRYLSENGFRVTTAGHAGEARTRLKSLAFDALVLDVMMPGEDGFALTEALRASSEVPILMLTAMAEAGDRIGGLERGADDYLVKPFEPQELLLRLRAILRRARTADGAAATPRAVQLGRVRFELEGMRLSAGAAAVHLTAAEARLLRQLAERPGEVLSRDDLAEPGGGGARNIDVQVTRLRRKIEPDPRYPRYLQTVRGRGYVLRPD